MPNHVTSRWEIAGITSDEFNEIKSNFKVAPGDFQSNFMGSYIPEPDDSEDYEWRDWRCENWGSKWDAFDIKFRPAPPHCLDVCFNTAWDPPNENFLRVISAKYPNALIRSMYIDEYQNFMGVSVAQDGIAFDERTDPDQFLPEQHQVPEGEKEQQMLVRCVDPATGAEIDLAELLADGPEKRDVETVREELREQGVLHPSSYGAAEPSTSLTEEEEEQTLLRCTEWNQETLSKLVSMLPARN